MGNINQRTIDSAIMGWQRLTRLTKTKFQCCLMLNIDRHLPQNFDRSWCVKIFGINNLLGATGIIWPMKIDEKGPTKKGNDVLCSMLLLFPIDGISELICNQIFDYLNYKTLPVLIKQGWHNIVKAHITNLADTVWHWRDFISTKCAICTLHSTSFSHSSSSMC